MSVTAPRRGSHVAHSKPTTRITLTEQITRAERPLEWWAGLIAASAAGAWVSLLVLVAALVVNR